MAHHLLPGLPPLTPPAPAKRRTKQDTFVPGSPIERHISEPWTPGRLKASIPDLWIPATWMPDPRAAIQKTRPDSDNHWTHNNCSLDRRVSGQLTADY